MAQTFPFVAKVVDQENRPLANAVLTINGTLFSSVSDSLGNFSLLNLPNGSYELQIALSNYHPYHAAFKINGKSLFKTIRLRPETNQLAEVLVSDKRIEQQRKEQSLNVTSVSGEYIKRYMGGSLMKSLERLPGIKTIGIGSGQSKPLIRGLGFNRVVVVDKGVKHEGQQWGADHGLEIDQFAVGQANLLKGAASFLYGSDAIGGAIDLRPMQVPAMHTLGGEVTLIGKTNNNLGGGSVNLFGRKEKWFFDSRFTYQNYGDYSVPADRIFVYDYPVDLYRNHLRNTAGKETGLHFTTGFVKDGFRSILYLSHTFNKSGFFANAHGLEPRQVDATLHDASARDILHPMQQVSHLKAISRTVYQKGHHQLAIDLGYQKNFRQEFSHYVNHGYMPPIYPKGMAVPSDLEREFDKSVYSLNASDKVDLGQHDLTFGFNAEYQQNAINGWSFLVPAFRQSTGGLFVLDQYKLNETLILTAGLRYDYGFIDIDSYQDWFASIDAANGNKSTRLTRANAFSRNFNSLVWSLGLNYNPGRFELKANIGKSFRMPIAKELAANGVNYHYFSYEKGNERLDPERAYQLDLGLSYRYEKIEIELSPFLNYFPNYIYLNPTATHDYFYGAGNQVFEYAQSRVFRYGGELQLKYNLASWLNASVLGEFLRSEQLSGAKKGFGLPFSPPPSVLFGLTYQPRIRALQDSYLAVDFRYTDRQYRIVPPERKTEASKIFNIQAGTKFRLYQQPITVGLQVQNVFNTKYFNHTSFYRLISLPEMGRDIVLLLKMPFQLSRSK